MLQRCQNPSLCSVLSALDLSLCPLGTPASSADWNLPLLTSCKAAVVGVLADRFFLAQLVRNLVHPSQMRKGVVEMQLLHTGSDLQEVVELDVALAAKVDFLHDVVSDVLVLGVTHLLHGVQEILLVDGTVVIAVQVLERLLEVPDLLGIELSSLVKLSLVQRSDTDSGNGGDGLVLNIRQLQASQMLQVGS